jgi:hypothetical protein
MPGDFTSERQAQWQAPPRTIFKVVADENSVVELPRQSAPGTVYSIMNLGPGEVTVIAHQRPPMTRWQHFRAALRRK